MKRRFMILFDDGVVVLTSKGHIKNEYKVEDTGTFTLAKNGKSFTMKCAKRFYAETVESTESDVWVSILKSIQQLLGTQKVLI